MATSVIRVLIADDHLIVRKGLRHIIDQQPDIRVVAEAGNYGEVAQAMREQVCDVLLLDISMPGKDGIEVLRTVKKRDPDVKVLILSAHAPAQFAVRSLKAGAVGYLTKDSAPEKLVDAIRTVALGRKYITPEIAESLAEHVQDDSQGMPHEHLSDREFQTVRLIASGRTLTEIANELCISPKTVSVYRARVLEKMGLHSNAEITHYAIKHGLVD